MLRRRRSCGPEVDVQFLNLVGWWYRGNRRCRGKRRSVVIGRAVRGSMRKVARTRSIVGLMGTVGEWWKIFFILIGSSIRREVYRGSSIGIRHFGKIIGRGVKQWRDAFQFIFTGRRWSKALSALTRNVHGDLDSTYGVEPDEVNIRHRPSRETNFLILNSTAF